MTGICASNGAAVTAERADGRNFNSPTTAAVGRVTVNVDVQLLQSGSSWTLIDSDDTVETYTGSSGKALLNSIQARDGYTQTLQYGAGNTLASVTDSFGRTLQFTYQGNLLQTVTTPDGLILSYGCDFQNRLASVTYSTSPQTSRTYLYENSSLPFALTGIIDEDGSRFATWAYDSIGHAISSQHATGADLTRVAYQQ